MVRAPLFLVTIGVLSVWAQQGSAPALVPDHVIASDLGKPAHLTYSSDGRLLGIAASGGYGWWDAQTGAPIRREAGAAGLSIAFSSSGNVAAVGGADGKVSAIDLRLGTSREAARHTKPVRTVALSSDGRLGASGDSEGTILLWDPQQGVVGTLKEGSSKAAVIFLGFTSAGTLLSLNSELAVVTWDVNGKRSLRRGALQSGVQGRITEATGASLDPGSDKLVVAAQLIAAPKGGVLTSGAGLARPGDLRRDNILLTYDVATGFSGDPVVSGDFKGETVALSPSGCYAFFTSTYRDQPRLHVWGLVEKGDDLLRQDLPRKANAVALDRSGRALAVAGDDGRVSTFKVSGATLTDCETYARAKKPGQAAGPKISLGTDNTPLLEATGNPRVAVLRFETTNASSDLGDTLAELISGELANNASVVVVERKAIDAIVKEMEIQRSGLTEAAVARIGKGLGAKKVFFGSVRRLGDDLFILTVRLVDVETQRIEGYREVSCERCREQDVLSAARELRRLLVK